MIKMFKINCANYFGTLFKIMILNCSHKQFRKGIEILLAIIVITW